MNNSCLESDEILFEIENDLNVEDELHTIIREEDKNVLLDDDEDEESTAAISTNSNHRIVYHSQLQLVDFKYKKDAVEYWRSGKGEKNRPMTAVRKNFRKVTHQCTLYQWFKQFSSSEEGCQNSECSWDLHVGELWRFKNW